MVINRTGLINSAIKYASVKTIMNEILRISGEIMFHQHCLQGHRAYFSLNHIVNRAKFLIVKM